jgi:hypothetical protein
MTTGQVTVIVLVGLELSVTWTVMLNAPGESGVPDNTPEELKLRPGGRLEPLVSWITYGPVPPDGTAVTE